MHTTILADMGENPVPKKNGATWTERCIGRGKNHHGWVHLFTVADSPEGVETFWLNQGILNASGKVIDQWQSDAAGKPI